MMAALLLAVSFAIPHQDLTPGGLSDTRVTQAEICAVRWGTDSRSVSPDEKKQVFKAYGIPQSRRTAYEVDHRIPRSAGGDDVVWNLWPQLWPEARKKDRLETLLHKRVCVVGDLSLEAAQQAFWGDWRVAYRQYIGELR